MDQHARFEALINDGIAASRDNRVQAALALFAQASELVPESGIPHFLIGSEHAAAGDIPAAETAFANAVLLSPEFVLARYQLGLLQFSSERAAMALVTWQPLFRLPEQESLGHFVRGFAALAQDQFDEALRHYRSGLACEGTNPSVATDIARVVEAVEGLSRRAGSPAPTPDSQHVLLAGYARLH